MKHAAIKQQQGVVLIWALAILLVLTILGVSSVKKANMGTKIAGNSMASMLVFQGAESALSKIANNNSTNEFENLAAVDAAGAGVTYNIPANILPNEPVSGGSIKSIGSVKYLETKPCPVTDFADGGSMCRFYRLEVESRLQGTGAKTKHVMGVAQMVAP